MADFDWPAKRMLDLEKLIDLCTSIDSWLRADVDNVAVIHCLVSKLFYLPLEIPTLALL